MKKTRVILADDHSILRYGLRLFLSSTDDIKVVGEASTGADCITLFKKHNPDICILDISMPDQDGIDVAKEIREHNAKTKIFFLSMHSDEKTLRKALSINVDGYLSKETPKPKILKAIREVMKGEKVYDDMIPREIIRSPEKESDPSPIDRITKRETEIIALVVEGFSSPEIAKKLFISRRTVDTHRNNIMQKLDLSNTASLVRFALENNLASSSDERKNHTADKNT